jgi:hypothetical protein
MVSHALAESWPSMNRLARSRPRLEPLPVRIFTAVLMLIAGFELYILLAELAGR